MLAGNAATGSGGGMGVLDRGGKITVSGSLFSDNTSSSAGRGIAIHQNNASDPVLVTPTGTPARSEVFGIFAP